MLTFMSEQYVPKVPAKLGITTLTEVSLATLEPFIDWTPFFLSWDIRGRYPAIFKDPVVGKQAQELYDDAQKLLRQLVAENLLTAKGVVGLFPANSINDDDIEVYTDESRTEVAAVLHTLRQQGSKVQGVPNLALADYIAPKESGIADYIGAFAVTTGIGADELAKQYQEQHDDYSSIMVKALADRFAEAFAEYAHALVRKELWGFAADEQLDNDALIKEKYQGIRPAPGYPACPDHTEKVTLFRLLEAEKHTSIYLTESMAMYPAASVSGWYFAHPTSKYFAIGKIQRDQVEDYARRKGWDIATAEQWLAPILGY